MSRRYPTADLYEERERDVYARPRAERNYEDLEVDVTRTRYPERAETVLSEARRPGRQPDFLREDYGRTVAGPLVVRERERERDADVRSVAGSRRGPPGPPERYEKDEMIIRERERDGFSHVGSRRGGPERIEKEELIIRERERGPPIRERPREREVREVEREEITIRRDEREPERPRRREREVEETDITIRRGGGEPPRGGGRGGRSERGSPSRHEFEREDIVFRRGGEGDIRSPPREREIERQELVIREEHSPPRRREYREVDREEVHIRERERSMPPPRERSRGPTIAREREEFVFRRREPSPPPPPRDYEKEEIIIRRRDRSIPREPSPEPEPEPIREPSPEPLPPIVRPPIIQEVITHHRHIDHGVERARSPTPPPRLPTPPPPPVQTREESLEIEIRRRGMRNGKKFYEEDIIFDRETGEGGREEDMQISRRRSASARPSRSDSGKHNNRKMNKDRWTEVTKDLVTKEAIDEMGYEFEESEHFFYVTEYLRYEDVLQLVELSEDIRRERRERIKEIQWEREEMERKSVVAPPAPRSKYDERIYEREMVYDSRRPGRYR